MLQALLIYVKIKNNFSKTILKLKPAYHEEENVILISQNIIKHSLNINYLRIWFLITLPILPFTHKFVGRCMYVLNK